MRRSLVKQSLDSDGNLKVEDGRLRLPALEPSSSKVISRSIEEMDEL